MLGDLEDFRFLSSTLHPRTIRASIKLSMSGLRAHLPNGSATILASIMCSDDRVQTYADVGRKAFGSRSVILISGLFCLELFSVRRVQGCSHCIEIVRLTLLSVILVTLFADSLFAVLPTYSRATYKLLSLFL